MGRGVKGVPRIDLRGAELVKHKIEVFARLTTQQAMYANKYAECLNVTKAAVEAGCAPKNAGPAGSRMMRRPDVLEAVGILLAERAQEFKLTTNKVVKALWRNHRTAIKGLPVYGKTGELSGYRPDLRASNEALIALGKYLGAFIEKVDVTSKGDKVEAPRQVMVIGGREVAF